MFIEGDEFEHVCKVSAMTKYNKYIHDEDVLFSIVSKFKTLECFDGM